MEGNGLSGEKKSLENPYDLIILDVMLPDRDGFQICKNIRDKGKTLPILILTARNTTIDTVMGLKLGADDYMSKPFEFQELSARIEALLRRVSNTPSDGKTTYTFSTFTLDTEKKELLHDSEPVPLNSLEYRLLEFLVKNPDKIVSRDEILDEVWGYGSETTTRTVDVYVAWLRDKLNEKKPPRHLITLRGRGTSDNSRLEIPALSAPPSKLAFGTVVCLRKNSANRLRRPVNFSNLQNVMRNGCKKINPNLKRC